jgi:hypothetical protein
MDETRVGLAQVSVLARRGRWGEVEGPARMPGKPCAHLRMFVSGVVVDDGMDWLLLRHLCLDGIEEADELLMAVVLHVVPDDGAIEHVKGSEQRGHAVTFVVVGHRARHGPASLAGLAGCGRALEFGCSHRPKARLRGQAD